MEGLQTVPANQYNSQSKLENQDIATGLSFQPNCYRATAFKLRHHRSNRWKGVPSAVTLPLPAHSSSLIKDHCKGLAGVTPFQLSFDFSSWLSCWGWAAIAVCSRMARLCIHENGWS